MPRELKELGTAWREALARDDSQAVEQLVREVLQEHTLSPLAAEIRYYRGMLTLTEGEGFGSQRLAKAMSEFESGIKAGEKSGEAGEPWRSLNRTQYGACLARLGNYQGAIKEWTEVSNYRPRTVMGLGALSLIAEVVREEKPRDAARYDSQRISYARTLARENKDQPDEHFMRFLLCQELLDSEFAAEGKKLLQEIVALGAEKLGDELFKEAQELAALQESHT